MAFRIESTQRIRKGGREEEALEEVEVGWAFSAWEGREVRLRGGLGGNGGEGAVYVK
ncbi:hypothetical protein PanWU01x14_145110, partial [Parasponia andersonii]